ncbi:MAG: prolyl oligopeptidase family serine peptidase, partial [Microcella pacifica]
SKRWLVIEASSSITSEARVLDAADPTGEFTVVWPREHGVEYDLDHAVISGEDRWLITHNREAPDFTVVSVPVDAPLSTPETLIPHEPGRRVEGVDAYAAFLTLDYRREGLPRTAIARLDGAQLDSTVDPHRSLAEQLHWDELVVPVHGGPDALASVGTRGNPEWHQPTLRIGWVSFIEPTTVGQLDVATGAITVLKRQPVLGDFATEEYEERRDWARADDGTLVPISLVWKRGLVPALDVDSAAGSSRAEVSVEPAPVLLYGYGSYEASMDPGFSIPRLSLLDRGVVFAIAHVRGGGELGRAWYEQGKTTSKTNTFTDFVACARHLVDTGVTVPERLVAEGGSAGGLLMGAVANLAGDLFAGILADVPFVRSEARPVGKE